MPAHFSQVPCSFEQLGRRKKQVLCSFSQVPDSFARRQDLKKEKAVRRAQLPPWVGQIYYIFQRKANPSFPVLTFAGIRTDRRKINHCCPLKVMTMELPSPGDAAGKTNYYVCNEKPLTMAKTDVSECLNGGCLPPWRHLPPSVFHSILLRLDTKSQTRYHCSETSR